MNGWIIAILVIVVITVLLVFCFRFIKKKIKNKIIDTGADIITKTTGNFLNEETASKVNEVTNVTAEILKKGKIGLITTTMKQELEIAKDKKE